ncbi:hypothetical protein D6833_05540 [Candidatus Parcubacteria bacterium]|nr:MAG: hypothetical protein D6833_05540 [Candidatus Parcubacteria bacterium]
MKSRKMSHKKTVEGIYAAFGRSDIPFILNQMAENVDWEYAYRRGRIQCSGCSRDMARKMSPIFRKSECAGIESQLRDFPGRVVGSHKGM